MAHFIDVNEEEEVYNLPYVDMLRRCEEAEKKMLFVQKQCENHGVSLRKVRAVDQLTELTQAFAEERKVAIHGCLDIIDKEINNMETFI